MKQILGCIRRADADFSMIRPGDRIAVGVSGGKDSLLLLTALAAYRRFAPNPFELAALTITMGLEPFDLSPVKALCRELKVPYIIKETDIGDIVFNRRKEKNPCALCARMRRGYIADACISHGYNKIALGHHRDDALESLMMSMFYEGRMRTFRPVTHLEDSGIAQIRPMIYVSERQAVNAARKLNLPVVESPCPANGKTSRADMKALLDHISRMIPNAREQMLSALKNHEAYSLWEPDSRRECND